MPSELGTSASFTGLACTSGSACLAVDSAGQTLRWDGRVWLRAAQIEPPAAWQVLAPAPTALACGSARVCVAVDDTGAVLQEQGSRWRRSHLPAASALSAVGAARASRSASRSTAAASSSSAAAAEGGRPATTLWRWSRRTR